jgi:hypothetical protein
VKFFGLFFILTCLPSALIDFALPVWKQQPAVQMEDAYKWIYQATRGGEHAAPDREMAADWLDKEWKTLIAPGANEPLWQPLCKDGSIGRLNLRPYKANGGDPDDLVDAFVAGANGFKGTETDFLAAWNDLGKRLKTGPAGALDRKKWKTLDAEMKKQDYPAIHHSEKYSEAFHPAYRILPTAQMKKLLEKAKQ